MPAALPPRLTHPWRRPVAKAAATIATSLAATALAQTPVIIQLEELSDRGHAVMSPAAITADGSFLVGTSGTDGPGLQAVRWSRDGSVQALPKDLGDALALAVSDDGRSVFGMVTTSSPHAQRAVRWLEDGPFEDLGEGFSTPTVMARDTSADGRVAVGSGIGFDDEPWWWREGVGMEPLRSPGWVLSTANAVSADGTAVLGHGWRPGIDDMARPYRWTQAGGAEDLGDPEPWSAAAVYSANSDLRVMVGTLSDASGRPRSAFRWREAVGYLEIGPSDEFAFPSLNALDGGGNVAVGQAYSFAAERQRAIFWTEATGVVDLRDYLVGIGVDMSEWQLSNATAISGDGTAVAGKGRFQGEGAQYLVTGLRLPGSCRVDLDGDGTATVFDFLAFQNLFDAGDLRADFDGDGELTLFDFSAFQAAFDAGCA